MDAETDTRWEQFELSGCIDSVEMRAAVGVLSEGVLALGEGDYRNKVMEQNDETRHLLMTKVLELDPDQNVRPVWS